MGNILFEQSKKFLTCNFSFRQYPAKKINGYNLVYGNRQAASVRVAEENVAAALPNYFKT
jgi:hypothetical protein